MRARFQVTAFVSGELRGALHRRALREGVSKSQLMREILSAALADDLHLEPDPAQLTFQGSALVAPVAPVGGR